jgi:parvulin-like peptidyl-prolyl isomerase
MGWQRRLLGVAWIGLGCWLTSGCMTVPDWAQSPTSPSLDISEKAMPTVRSQSGDGAGVKLQDPRPVDAPPPGVIPPPPGIIPPPPDKEVVQTSAIASRGMVRISIRAWVNDRPIYDEEVRQLAFPAINSLMKLPDSQRGDEMVNAMNKVLERIIDQEVMYQDAVKRLKQANKTAYEKLQAFVDHEFTKTLKNMRDKGASEKDIRNIEPIARRLMERELIATEYARTLIKGRIDRVSLDEIAEYYETHKNEFLTVDRVEWQDIFIRLNANLPTVEHAKRFGEELINKCRTPEDFNRLMVYNEGVTKHSGGEGLGNLRGQIQPRELEETLFKLRPGEIGPVVPVGTGVHLIRVTKRDYAGQKPLDYVVQKAIRRKLESEIADHEYRCLVRELRARAIIRLEREVP